MTRDLTHAEMEEVLESHSIGTLACMGEDEKPYMFPMAYVYTHGALYGQTTEGLKTEILRTHPRVCFSVVEKHHGGWRSVLLWGRFEELECENIASPDIAQAITLLYEHLRSVQKEMSIDVAMSIVSGKPVPMTVNGRTAVLFRVSVAEMTGKGGGG